MDGAKSLTEQFSDSANEFWTTVGDYLPQILGALVLIIVALIAAKLAQWLVEYILKMVRVDKLAKQKQVAKTLKSAELSVDVVSIAGRIAFWIIIIIFALTIAEVLKLTAMRDVIRDILNYLPNVLAAAIVLTVAIGGARLLRDVIAATLSRMRIGFANNVASGVFYVLIVFGSLMALDQLGFDTTILSANITIIVAGIVFALSLAFGLGGRDTAKKVVDETYSNYKTSIHKRR